MAKADVKISIKIVDEVTDQLKKVGKNFSKFRSKLKTDFAKGFDFKVFKDFKQLKGDFKTTERGLRLMAQAAKNLRDQFLKGNVALSPEKFKELNKEIRRLDVAYNQIIKEQIAFVRRQNPVRTALRRVGIAFLKATFSIKNFKTALKAIGRTLKTTTASIKLMGRGLISIGRSILRIGSFAALGFGGLGAFIVKTTADFELFGLQIQAVNNNIVQTSKEFAELRAEAARSPLSSEEFIESFTRLKALGVEEALGTSKKLGQVAAVFGRDLRDITAAFISLESRTLRRLGINIARTGKNAIIQSGNILKVVTKDTESIRNAIKEIFAEKFPNAFAIIESSLSAQFKVLKSGIQEIAADIGRVTVRAPLLAALQGVNKFLITNSRSITTFFSALVNDTKNVVKLINDTLDAGLSKLKGSTEKIGLADSIKKAIIAAGSILLDAIAALAINLARPIATAIKIGVRGALNEINELFGLSKNAEREAAQGELERQKMQLRTAKKKLELDKSNVVKLSDFERAATIRNIATFEDGIRQLRNKLKRIGPLTSAQLDEKDFKDLFTTLATENKQILDKTLNNSRDFITATGGLLKDGFTGFDKFFFQPFKKGFEGIGQRDELRRLVEDLRLLRDSGKKGTQLVDIKNIKANFAVFKKQTEELQSALTSGKIDTAIDRIGKKILKLSFGKELTKDTQPIVDRLVKEAEKLQKLQGMLSERNNLLKVAGDLNILGETAKDSFDRTAQAMEALSKIDVFEGRTLGSQALDKIILENKALTKTFTTFIAQSGSKFVSYIESQKGVQQALKDLVKTDISFTKEVTGKLIDASFKDLQLANVSARRIEATTGKISKALRAQLREFAKSEKGAKSLFTTLSKGGQAQLARDFFKSAKGMTLLSDAILNAKGQLADFGKEINLLDEQQGGAITARFIEDLRKRFTAEGSVFNETLGISIPFKEFDEAGFLDAVQKMKESANTFLNKDGFLRPEVVERSIKKLNIPTALQNEFREFAKAFKTTSVLNRSGELSKAFVESTGVINFELAKLADKTTDSVSIIKKELGTLSDEGKLKFFEYQQSVKGTTVSLADFLVKIKEIQFASNLDFAKGARDAFVKLTDQLGNLNGLAADVTNRLTTGLADGATNAILDFAKGTKTAAQAFTELATSIIEDLARMLVKFLVFNAVVGLTNLITSGGGSIFGAGAGAAGGAGGVLGAGGIGSSFVDPFGLENGGVTPAVSTRIPMRARAKGGVAASPELAIFGEGRNAEAFVPLPDNRRIPVQFNGKKGKDTAAPAQPIIMQFTVNAIDSQGVAQFLRDNRKMITGVVADTQQRNRNLRPAFFGGRR